MKKKIIIELSSGKKIELTEEEFEELQNSFGNTETIIYKLYPEKWTPWWTTQVTPLTTTNLNADSISGLSSSNVYVSGIDPKQLNTVTCKMS